MLGEDFCTKCEAPTTFKCIRCDLFYCSYHCMKDHKHEHGPRNDNQAVSGAVKNRNMASAITVQTGTGIVKKRPSAWEKSLTTEAYKIMKDKLPDDVKSGKHISVQNRLAKALSKSSATGTKTELVNESGSVNENMAMQASSGAYRGQCWYNSVEQAKETLAYKVMEPKLPPVVKEGARVSATDRLVILMDRELEMDAYNAQYGAEDLNRQVGDEKMECDVPDYSHLLEIPKFSDLKFDVKTEEQAKKFVATAFKFWELNCLNRLSESEMEILNDKLDELEKVYPNTCKFSSAQ